jgi:hypothetical protein
MPTLEELFKNGTLTQGPYAGQTPKDAFAVRDSNKIELSSNSPVINATSMKLVNRLRNRFPSPLEETLLEQEITGLRPLWLTSFPLLYGTQTGRFITRSTKPLSDMKSAAGATGSGLFGSILNSKAGQSIQSAVGKVSNFLGIPTLATPTYVVNSGLLQKDENAIQEKYNDTLKRIRNKADGNLVGRLLANALSGRVLTDPEQLKNQAISGALSLAKSFLTKVIIGGKTPTTNNYDFENNPIYANGVRATLNYGPLIFGGGALTTLSGTNKLNANGSTYSSFFTPTLKQNAFVLSGIYAKGSAGMSMAIVERKLFKDSTQIDENENFGLVKNTPYPTIAGLGTTTPFRADKVLRAGGTDKQSSITAGTKGQYSSYTHVLNRVTPYTTANAPKPDNKTLEELDNVVLKFESEAQKKTVNFLATITGLSESFSPSWDSAKFIGSPFNYYTYNGIERSVSFGFKVFSLNALEHKSAWERLNFLTSLVYPQNNANYVVPPLFKFTLGSMYEKKWGFIESLSYNIDDNTDWQVGNTARVYENVNLTSSENLTSSSPSGETTIDMKKFILPKIVSVDITIKFIESRSLVKDKKFYTFEPTDSTVKNFIR